MWVNGHAWIDRLLAAKGNRTVFQREALRTGGLATKACADAERSLPDLWLTSADQPGAATNLKLNIQEGSEYEQARRYQDYQHEGAL
jgi:hypothetical protein